MPERDLFARVLTLEVVGGAFGGETYPLTAGQYLIGRGLTCDIRVPEDDLACSRDQAMIRISGDSVRISDRNSANGTYVNEVRVNEHELAHGDMIRVGKTQIAVEMFVPPSQTVPRVNTPPVGISTARRRSSMPSAPNSPANNETRASMGDDLPDFPQYGEILTTSAATNDVRSGNPVIVRRVRPEFTRNLAAVESFRKTTSALLALDNLAVEKVRGIHAEGELVEIVVDAPNGRELAKILEDAGGRIPVAYAVGIVLGVLEAIRAAHESGLRHFCLTPTCIFVDGDPAFPLVSVGQFGLAPHFWTIGMEAKLGDELRSPLAYVAKEQVESSGRDDRRIDLFAVGALLYRMLVGRGIYLFDESLEPACVTIREDVRAEGIRPSIGLSSEMIAFLGRATSVSPDSRFQTAQEMSNALDRVALDR